MCLDLRVKIRRPTVYEILFCVSAIVLWTCVMMGRT